MTRVGKGSLLALVLFSWALILEVDSFDLNEPALDDEGAELASAAAAASAADDEDEQMPEAEQAGQSASSSGPPTSGDSHRAPVVARPTASQIRKLQAMYPKILRLFELLKICDTDQFDIDLVEIPSSWAQQAKAMMVLNKLGKQKLIKKSDMPRFRRIMENCNQIDEVVRNNEERSLSLESQMSGMNDEDLEKFRRDQEENPLDSLRKRFMSSGRLLQQPPSKMPVKSTPAPTLAPTRAEDQFHSGGGQAADSNPSQMDDEGPALIRFL